MVILKIFYELGISGRKADKRPEFQKMIALAKSDDHPVDYIVVWKFSRFARNQEESIVYKSLLKKKHNVEVVSVSEPIIDGPFGSLIERIIEWMDEYYSVRLSGEVTRGMTEKAKRGGYQARPPLGYRIQEHGKPPVIVPEEAEIVKLIFNKYVNEHIGFFDIARYLNLHGFKTSHNKPFERRSIEYILQNPTYCGMVRWNRVINETKEIRPESEWIISDGQHPAIISKELFEQAQARRKSEYRPSGTRPSSTYKHWLSGLVKCLYAAERWFPSVSQDLKFTVILPVMDIPKENVLPRLLSALSNWSPLYLLPSKKFSIRATSFTDMSILYKHRLLISLQSSWIS